MLNIAVLVSGGGTNLQAILDAEKRGALPLGKVSLVVASKPGVYALERAQKAGVKSTVLCPKDFSNNEEFDKALLALMRENEIDLIVLAGFLTILGSHIIDAYPNRIINVHPSLIPSFCGEGFYGLKVHRAALDYGVKLTGATVHYVSQVCDGGEIILQKAVEIMPGDTPEILQKRVMEEAEWELLPKAIDLVCQRLTALQE